MPQSKPRPTVTVTATETVRAKLETGKKSNSQVSSLFSLCIIYCKDTIIYPVWNVDLYKFPADSLVRQLFYAQCSYTPVFHFQQAAINSNNMLIINCCGCPLPGRVQGQVGQGLDQPGLVEGVPARGRGVGTRWPLRSLPTQTSLWF